MASTPPVFSPQAKRQRRRFPDLPHHVFDPRAPFVARLHVNNLTSEEHAKRTKGEDRGVIGLGRFDQNDRKQDFRFALADLRKPTQPYTAPRPTAKGANSTFGGFDDDHANVLNQEVMDHARRIEPRSSDPVDDGIDSGDEADARTTNMMKEGQFGRTYRAVTAYEDRDNEEGVEPDIPRGRSNGLNFEHPDLIYQHTQPHTRGFKQRFPYPRDDPSRGGSDLDIRTNAVGRGQYYLQNVQHPPQPPPGGVHPLAIDGVHPAPPGAVDNAAVPINGVRGAPPEQ